MEPKRLNKFISDTGFCSRREADRLIEEERVTVNGRMPEPGMKVTPKDKVRIDDQILSVRDEQSVFLALNKPSGMSATSDMGVRDNVVRAINHPASLQPIGRLDREDEGILFLSNDNDLVRLLTKGENKLEKELIVTVSKPFSSDFISRLSEACASFEDGVPQKAVVTKESTTRFRIVLEPGMNHSIKKICESLGNKVTFLQRIRIEQISLTKLQKGHWRALAPGEIENLKRLVSGKSGKTASKAKAETREFAAKGGAKSDRSTNERGGYKKSAKASAAEKGGPGMRIGKSRPAAAAGGKGTRGGAKSGGGKAGGGKKGTTGRSSGAAPKRSTKR